MNGLFCQHMEKYGKAYGKMSGTKKAYIYFFLKVYKFQKRICNQTNNVKSYRNFN